VLEPDEVLVEQSAREGWAVAAADGVAVGVNLRLDDELLREGRLLDLVHTVNVLRKEAGLELTDRIALTIPQDAADLLDHEDFIKGETLAVAIDVGGELGVSRTTS
jgi:isoleucyl-tRNA synthetase